MIEGETSVGIYKFYRDDSIYHEIKDAAAVSKFFDEEPNFDYRDEKIICRSDRIIVGDLKTGEELCFFEKRPLTFFDVHCPLCRQKVVTYETESDHLGCEVVFLPCRYFVGNAVWCGSGYETEALKNLGLNHKSSENQLYFETADGWRQPVIYAPPNQLLDSFWDGSNSAGDYADHFFFIESEPRFSTE